MKKIVLSSLAGCVLFVHSLVGSLSADLKNGAHQIRNAPVQLNQIPEQLMKMYNEIGSKVAVVDAGIAKIKTSMDGVAKARREIESNKQAPDEIKTKIIAALSKLQDTLPAILNIFLGLKYQMTTLQNSRGASVDAIVGKVNEITRFVNGDGRVTNIPIRLLTLANMVEKGEQSINQIKQVGEHIKQDFDQAGQAIKTGFENFGKDVKSFFHVN